MKHKITFILLFLVSGLGYGQIVSWEMEGNNGNEVLFNATTLNPNLNPSILSRGGGIIPDGFGNGYSSANFTVNGTQANSITNNDYLEFQISATNGYQVSLSTLDVNFRRSNTGPNSFLWRFSTDGLAFFDINIPFTYNVDSGNGTAQTQINLTSIPVLQNVAFGTTIIFRLYGWGATNANGTFAIGRINGDDLSLSGTVNAIPCSGGTLYTWESGGWNPIGTPTINDPVIINENYDTATNGGSFSACSLTVNTGFRLIVNDGYFVEVENNVTVNGELWVQTQGALVQNDDAGTFTGIGRVNKTTAQKQYWYYYTYWSSPVFEETIAGAFPDTDADRRFSFNASSFIDSDGDDIDDDGNDWVIEAGGNTMISGIGYAATSSRLGIYPSNDIASFNGRFNTGNITTGIIYNAINTLGSWNFIGNPYPSAIDFIAFQTANSAIIDGAAYFWSQSLPPDVANPGNEVSNFNQNDYATFTVGTGGAAGASGIIPNQFIPSGQGFFIPSLANGNVTFTNAMRMSDGTSNNQFFRVANSKKQTKGSANKIWVNLTSDNGVFNQVLVGYVYGATKNYDGLSYDAPRNLSSGGAAILYTNIEGSNKKFAIQGKAENSINEDEVISVGFKTSINVPTIYTLSIAQFEGDFLNDNPVYIKDNLLNTSHNLKDSDYNFTSEVGEFNDRFEIVFSEDALSLINTNLIDKSLAIIEHQNGDVQFKLNVPNKIKAIKIIDLQGRVLYNFNVNSNDETFKLSNLSQAAYIAKVKLNDGYVITKKAIKRF